MFDAKAKITLGDDTAIELDVLRDTFGQDVVDIHSLGSRGVFTFDPGFTSTTSCESKITFIGDDGETLLHRGFPIDQLATGSNYLGVCYILLCGERPTQAEHDGFKTTVTRHTMIYEQIMRPFHVFRRDSRLMVVICGITDALAVFYHDLLDVNNLRHREITAYRLLSEIPTMAAMCYKYSIDRLSVYPRNDLFCAGNFLHMMSAMPRKEYKVNPVLKRAMDRILVLHANHEQNALTSIIRTVGSSGANPFTCIITGIASLWGPAHGDANEAALKMLEGISSVEHTPEFVRRAKDKNGPFRLMGFGYRVYENYDPHATVMREACHEVPKGLGTRDDLLQVAMELKYIALNDPYFIEKRLCPNVDFYSGIILKTMGIPSSMFTVTPVVARTVGWIVHWNETHSDGMKIARPRQLCTGCTKCDYQSDIKR